MECFSCSCCLWLHKTHLLADLQQKFDQEHKLRNAAENDLKASQKTNEDLSKRIEELQEQVQTEKVKKTNFRFACNYQMKVQRIINISS